VIQTIYNTVVQFTLCRQSALAFAIEGPLHSKGICHRGLFLQTALAFAFRLAFAFKVILPLPSKRPFAFAIDGPLPSKSLCHPKAFAVEGPLPLASKGLFF
jgi:hypothetical protein